MAMRSSLVLLLLSPLLAAQPQKTVPAINDVEAWQQVGQQPYEMTWTQRQEHPKTLVDFEDLTGWTLELYDGAEGELRRSREQQMWGMYVAKFWYRGTASGSRIVARPPKPVPIPERFDSIELWGYGNRWAWVRDETTPPAVVSVIINDARGREFTIQLTDINWKQWWLIHRRVPKETLEQMVWPASFAGLEISKIRHTEPRYFYCDSLAFYTEQLGPLEFKPQPQRNLRPYRGQIAGLNTGTGKLPFPTREETILPENFEREFRTRVRQLGPRTFEFVYEGRDARVVYQYAPGTANLGEITASVNGGAPLKPMDGGGVRFADAPEKAAPSCELLWAALSGEVVEARFRCGSRLVEYNLQLWQKSLVLDVWCDGGEATELSFGRVSGLSNPRLITIPYLTYGSSNPRVAMAGSPDKPIFISVWFDWYRSNASEPYFAAEPKVTADSAEINGGMRYIPKTDGLRNNLYERIFITVSPRYEETLPTIPNPPSLRQQEGKQVVWTVTEPRSFRQDHERSRRIRSYGLDKIMQHSHEVTWRDEGDSFTMRLRAAPQKGGDAMLAWYIRAQNELGWLQGVYTNYTDFSPTNTNWNPDFVQRTPEGEWRRAWPRNYALKPAKAVEMDEYYAPRIKQKFGVRMSYTDVHTAVAPWRYCDYDARVPGAGTFAATFYAYGQLLLNDQRIYGPTQSEATYQWMYAGLESGSYGWVYTNVNLLTHPPDPAFKLYKIHPLEASYGMGYTHYYLDRLDPKWKESPRRRDYVDLFLATTIAYGNLGWLVTDWGLDDPLGVEVMTRSYYMLQQLQQQYAFVRPRRIEYAGADGRMLDPSHAHSTGAIAGSRIHVEYENGTHVWVNRASQGTWTVRDSAGRDFRLPPSGWLAWNTAVGLLEFSAEIEGRRVDYVRAPEYEFLDGRGQWTEYGRLGATGSVVRRDREGGVIELIDIYGNQRIVLQAPAGRLLAYDAEDKLIGPVATRTLRPGWLEFEPAAGARRYVFTPSL
jgi:hypothetical protein